MKSSKLSHSTVRASLVASGFVIVAGVTDEAAASFSDRAAKLTATTTGVSPEASGNEVSQFRDMSWVTFSNGPGWYNGFTESLD